VINVDETVENLEGISHKEFSANLKSARVNSSSTFEG
jgi:hypothetical protein